MCFVTADMLFPVIKSTTALQKKALSIKGGGSINILKKLIYFGIVGKALLKK